MSNYYDGRYIDTHQTEPTAEEARLMQMTPAERRDHIEQMEWNLRKADRDAEEARFQAQVDAATG